ncbi:hypothetical protein JAAARDRAFT_435642 [Jaapia argillacea MUCL 33604]|uniref:Uncharacterized protein n=1 Tax=Jaapia argillacea MUCL 33604 TaxID=933084 RepID=A0A067PP93_9AGAM|nr:hypothetical protein JAAARDRAFT_435642 [Jaapia argillacea MUCL 33604]
MRRAKPPQFHKLRIMFQTIIIPLSLLALSLSLASPLHPPVRFSGTALGAEATQPKLAAFPCHPLPAVPGQIRSKQSVSLFGKCFSVLDYGSGPWAVSSIFPLPCSSGLGWVHLLHCPPRAFSHSLSHSFILCHSAGFSILRKLVA